MKQKDKETLKKVAIALGTGVAIVGIGLCKLTRKNKEDIDGDNMGEMDIEQCIEIDEKIESMTLNDEFINPIADVDLDTEEEYEEYMRNRFGENADEMMEKVESISSYAEVYMESGYEHGSNYHDEPYYTEAQYDAYGSEYAYDLSDDKYIGGDLFDLVENHEENGFPEYHWE